MKKIKSLILATVIIVASMVTNIQAKENIVFNKYNNIQVSKELNKLHYKVKKLLIDNNISIEYDTIEQIEENRTIHGTYYWNDNKIIINNDNFSIEYALIHEIGHSLDDILDISANEVLQDCYIESEIQFNDNDYFYSDFREYIAESIKLYFNNQLDINTKTYKELNQILNNL